MIHPVIEETFKFRTEEWKEQVDKLLRKHPRADKMLHLLDHPELAREVGKERADYPNCFGTTLEIIGGFQKPGHILEEEMAGILRDHFKEIPETELPKAAERDIITMMGAGETFWHGGVYLGKIGQHLFFERYGTGKTCRVVTTFMYPWDFKYFERK